jgi:hypothetical protein
MRRIVFAFIRPTGARGASAPAPASGERKNRKARGKNGAGLDFGSLNDVLGNADPYRNVIGWLESEDEFRKQHPDVVDELHKADPTGKVNLMRSAGPISDRYILSAAPASLIIGAASTSLLSGRLSVTAKTPSRPKFCHCTAAGGALLTAWRQ